MTDQNGRDPQTGQFLPGNPGGPGRPRGVTLRRVVESSRPDFETDLLRIYDKLVSLATAGDVQAARLLLDRVCAKDEDGPGGRSLEQILASSWSDEERVVLRVVTGVPE